MSLLPLLRSSAASVYTFLFTASSSISGYASEDEYGPVNEDKETLATAAAAQATPAHNILGKPSKDWSELPGHWGPAGLLNIVNIKVLDIPCSNPALVSLKRSIKGFLAENLLTG